MLTLRARRIENEWLLLNELQETNRSRLRVSRENDGFAMEVEGFPALLRQSESDVAPIGNAVTKHSLRVAFPRYYPSMPAEIYVEPPVFHPNVHPVSGFVCLWARHQVQTTFEQHLAQLQRVLSWQLLNPNAEHLMQPAALRWLEQDAATYALPLPFTPFRPVHPAAWESGIAPLRRRLSL